MADTLVIAESAEENTGFRFSWSLAIAGGVAATAVTFLLLTLGAGFGLLLVGAATPAHPGFLTGGGLYFFTSQAFGFAVGGYLAGRLLGPLVETHFEEDFRAAAHGLVAWAVAVLATLIVVTLSAAETNGAALYAIAPHDVRPTAYFVDRLFDPAERRSYPESGAARAAAERLLKANTDAVLPMDAADRQSLIALVSAQTGLSISEASARVDAIHSSAQTNARNTRKAASYASLWLAFSLIFGAAVAMAAAVLARIEDDREMAVPDRG